MPDEPQDINAKVQYYLALVPRIPEYDWLVGTSRQGWYGIGELERRGLSRKSLRSAFEAGLLYGARDEGGSRGLQVPWSGVVIHVGRQLTGWYTSQGQSAAG